MFQSIPFHSWMQNSDISEIPLSSSLLWELTCSQLSKYISSKSYALWCSFKTHTITSFMQGFARVDVFKYCFHSYRVSLSEILWQCMYKFCGNAFLYLGIKLNCEKIVLNTWLDAYLLLKSLIFKYCTNLIN